MSNTGWRKGAVCSVLLLAICGGLTACGGPIRMYSGPARETSQIARLHSSTGIFVREVDGRYTQGSIIDVLPGKHTIWARTNAPGQNAFRFVVELKAGKEYQLALIRSESARGIKDYMILADGPDNIYKPVEGPVSFPSED